MKRIVRNVLMTGMLAASAALAQQPTATPPPAMTGTTQPQRMMQQPGMMQGQQGMGVISEDQLKRCQDLQRNLQDIASSLATAKSMRDSGAKLDAAITAMQRLVETLQQAHTGCPMMLRGGMMGGMHHMMGGEAGMMRPAPTAPPQE